MAKMKATIQKEEHPESHLPVPRACRRVRQIVLPAVGADSKLSKETQLILQAIQAATEDIAKLLLELPNERMIDFAAVVSHVGKTLTDHAGDKLAVIDGKSLRNDRDFT